MRLTSRYHLGSNTEAEHVVIVAKRGRGGIAGGTEIPIPRGLRHPDLPLRPAGIRHKQLPGGGEIWYLEENDFLGKQFKTSQA
jgi:hypothetical protein